MSALKELRREKELTQQQVATLLGMSLRSYKSYENEKKKEDSLKYKYIIDRLSLLNPIDEEHGIVSIEYIRRKCTPVFEKCKVDYCYLFGSYAKDKAKETSDVDLLLSTKTKGMRFFGLVEELRTALRKNVDVLDVNQLEGNLDLTKEILKDGIKIYG